MDDTQTEQGQGGALVTDLDIMLILESILINDEVIRVDKAHKAMIKLRDYYEGELAARQQSAAKIAALEVEVQGWRVNDEVQNNKINELRQQLADANATTEQLRGGNPLGEDAGQEWEVVRSMKVRDRTIGEFESCDFDVRDGLIEVIDPRNHKLRHNIRLLESERLCRRVSQSKEEAR